MGRYVNFQRRDFTSVSGLSVDGRRGGREGTDNIRAEIHSKGSAQALGCPRAGLRARETGGGGRPARFCQEQMHVLAEQFGSTEHDGFRVPYLSDKTLEAAFNGQAVDRGEARPSTSSCRGGSAATERHGARRPRRDSSSSRREHVTSDKGWAALPPPALLAKRKRLLPQGIDRDAHNRPALRHARFSHFRHELRVRSVNRRNLRLEHSSSARCFPHGDPVQRPHPAVRTLEPRHRPR